MWEQQRDGSIIVYSLYAYNCESFYIIDKSDQVNARYSVSSTRIDELKQKSRTSQELPNNSAGRPSSFIKEFLFENKPPQVWFDEMDARYSRAFLANCSGSQYAMARKKRQINKRMNIDV